MDSDQLIGLLLFLIMCIFGYFGDRMSQSKDDATAAEGRRISERTARVFIFLFVATVGISMVLLVVGTIRAIL